MVTPSSILAWETPGTEEPGGLQSMRSQRMGYTGAHTVLVSGANVSAGDHPPGAGEDLGSQPMAWPSVRHSLHTAHPIYTWETSASLGAQTVKSLPAMQETRV